MNKLWKRIDTLLANQAPEVFESLQPPASLDLIRQTEKELNLTFPDELVDAYLAHNGQPRWHEVVFVPGFFADQYGMAWLGLRDMAREVQKWKGASENILSTMTPSEIAETFPGDIGTMLRKDIWNPHRIPIAKDSTGVNLFVDLMPGSAGTRGQIVFDDGDGDYLDEQVIAPSLNDYLLTFISHLEHGRLTYDAVTGTWINNRTGEPVLDWRSFK